MTPPKPRRPLRRPHAPATTLLAAGLLIAAGAAAPPPAAAQHPCPGHISATTLRPVPRDASFGIALRGDGDIERALRDRAVVALRESGRRVADPPSHVLSWRGGLSMDGAASAPLPSLYGPIDSFQDSDDLHWMQDVPRLRRRDGGGGGGGAPATVRLNGVVELRERASGRVVWTALVSCDRHGNDQAALIGTLVGAVVPLIGQTVSGRGF
jgi:hypothetical protein